jgi:hypothetical protein
MKHTVLCSADAKAAISCDRCGRTWTVDVVSEAEFTSVDYIGGYDSVFGDGSQVELDLCQQCLKQSKRGLETLLPVEGRMSTIA